MAKDLVWKLKFGPAKAAADEIGRMLAVQSAFARPESVIITHVPTAAATLKAAGARQVKAIIFAQA